MVLGEDAGAAVPDVLSGGGGDECGRGDLRGGEFNAGGAIGECAAGVGGDAGESVGGDVAVVGATARRDSDSSGDRWTFADRAGSADSIYAMGVAAGKIWG